MKEKQYFLNTFFIVYIVVLLYCLLSNQNIIILLNRKSIIHESIVFLGIISVIAIITKVFPILLATENTRMKNALLISFVFYMIPLLSQVYIDMGFSQHSVLYSLCIAIIYMLSIPFVVFVNRKALIIFLDEFRLSLLFYIGIISIFYSIGDYYVFPQKVVSYRALHNLFMGSMILTQLIIEYYVLKDNRRNEKN